MAFHQLKAAKLIHVLKTDMSKVPKKHFKKRVNPDLDNMPYRIIDYIIRLTFLEVGTEVRIRLELIVKIKGKPDIRVPYETKLETEANHTDIGSLVARWDGPPAIRT
jgi:hypothetical protein